MLLLAKNGVVVHIIGIGGIGMSAIAQMLHFLNIRVQGSDTAHNDNVSRLRNNGIEVFVGHNANNLGNATYIIVSSAIKESNPELLEAKLRGIPIVTRAEVLAELTKGKTTIAISGTHGKTTTTALVGSILEAASLDPTIMVGGILGDSNTNIRIGYSDYLVVEADESDGTFTQISRTIAVVTNINSEHLDFHGNFSNIQHSFLNFMQKIAFYGVIVACIDHEDVRYVLSKVQNRAILTYGIKSNDANIQAINIQLLHNHSVFDVVVNQVAVMKNVRINVPGLHNILNALAGVAVSTRLGCSMQHIIDGINKFTGVQRRFTLLGHTKNNITIVDDYAHHPEELICTIAAARNFLTAQKLSGRLFVVFQPHKYSRLRDLFQEFIKCFHDVDYLFVAPVYSAKETPIIGIDHKSLALSLQKTLCTAVCIEDFGELYESLVPLLSRDDLVLFAGAGDITYWAHKFYDKILSQQ